MDTLRSIHSAISNSSSNISHQLPKLLHGLRDYPIRSHSHPNDNEGDEEAPPTNAGIEKDDILNIIIQ